MNPTTLTIDLKGKIISKEQKKGTTDLNSRKHVNPDLELLTGIQTGGPDLKGTVRVGRQETQKISIFMQEELKATTPTAQEIKEEKGVPLRTEEEQITLLMTDIINPEERKILGTAETEISTTEISETTSEGEGRSSRTQDQPEESGPHLETLLTEHTLMNIQFTMATSSLINCTAHTGRC